MTAQIFDLKGRPIAAASPARARTAPVAMLSVNDEQKMRAWAEEKMRDAIRVYRSMFSSQELVMRLARAAEDELRLIETAR